MSTAVYLDTGPYRLTVRAFQERSKKSWQQIAKESGVDPSYLTRTVGGSRLPPSREIVVVIARTMGLSRAEARLLLEAAGWGEGPLFQRGNYTVHRPQARRPFLLCRQCGNEWRPGLHVADPTCPRCERYEEAARAERIAGYKLKLEAGIVVLPGSGVEPIPSMHQMKDAPLEGRTRRCRGCRRTFLESTMILIRLEGYYCVPCQSALIDRLCFEASV